MSVHPHACGEIHMIELQRHRHFGTSPRLWGDSTLTFDISTFARYIPTPVGRFPHCKKGTKKEKVHPHACGEIPATGVYFYVIFGTSPRLWGDSATAGYFFCLNRYIPTPVGRLPSPVSSSSFISVHPHACGEIKRLLLFRQSMGGTSPRLWGD